MRDRSNRFSFIQWDWMSQLGVPKKRSWREIRASIDGLRPHGEFGVGLAVTSGNETTYTPMMELASATAIAIP